MGWLMRRTRADHLLGLPGLPCGKLGHRIVLDGVHHDSLVLPDARRMEGSSSPLPLPFTPLTTTTHAVLEEDDFRPPRRDGPRQRPSRDRPDGGGAARALQGPGNVVREAVGVVDVDSFSLPLPPSLSLSSPFTRFEMSFWFRFCSFPPLTPLLSRIASSYWASVDVARSLVILSFSRISLRRSGRELL